MKRFIDLTGQLYYDSRRAFCFYCSVLDDFEQHGGMRYWHDWSEFARHYRGDDLTRYKRLCPAWVFNEGAQQ